MSDLSATAASMLETLPAYYWGNPLMERIVQAAANVVDRIDSELDALRDELIPASTNDDHGLLSMWETMLRLPVAPADATVEQRVSKITARLQALNAAQSRDTMSALRSAAGNAPVVVHRNTPAMREDTIEIPFPDDSYEAGQLIAAAQAVWPAHRLLHVHYATGFRFDRSRLDQDTF